MMGKSARILGDDYGLNAQETNQMLKAQGFLDGNPGAYFVTEKGAKFANETGFHRGPGGYSRYNRDWTQRTWDESIKNVLDTSSESLTAARNAVSEARRMKRDQLKVDRAAAGTSFQASRPDLFPSETPNISSLPSDASGHSSSGRTTAEIVVGGTALILLAGYGIHKVAPHVKKWWCNKVVPFFKGEDK